MKPYSLVVYDRDGKFLSTFLASDGQWRLKTSPGEIPEPIKRIILAKEDRFFYFHPGVNPFSLCRALYQNLRSRKRISGASTITMQVARMLEPKRRTYAAKAIEIFRAFQIELRYSKKEILELYLSLLPLGGNIEGLKSAALIYYQTPLERLNIAQLFDLMLIPNNPNRLRPDRNSENLMRERQRRSASFFARSLLTRQDSLIFDQTSAGATRNPFPSFASHFCLRVKQLAGSRASVRTTLHLHTQLLAERLLSDHLRYWKMRGVENGSVLILENKTMNVLAYVGSEQFHDSLAGGQIDAVQALRSPGSTLKPFLYALLMDRGTLTPKTRLLDVPYDAEGYTAENYDGTFSGFVFADEALQRSLNVPMVRLLKNIGLSEFVPFCKDLGLTSIETQQSKLGLSMILGGCGVTLEELTAGYAAFPNSGMSARPRFIQDTSSVQRKRVFSDGAAFMVTEILSDVRRPDMPANIDAAMHLPRIAFKTGTSYGRRDAWAVGYTAEYTIGVWIGNVTNKGAADLMASKTAVPLLIDLFRSVSKTNQKSILAMPPEINTRDVCAESGKIPTPRCAHTIEDYYSMTSTIPVMCDIENEYLVSPDGKKTYCMSCLSGSNYRVQTIRDYPKELLNYWKRTGKPFVLPPPHNPLCTRIFTGEGPKILSPTNGMTYLTVSNDDKITLHATSEIDVRTQCWYLDSHFLGRVRTGETLFKALSTGQYIISCLDDKGRKSSVTINVKRM
jgi:penicillin-binding protein 1C